MAGRIALSDGEDASRLPAILRRVELDERLESTSRLERASARAERIVDDARRDAEAIRESAERESRESAERGYRDGLERARVSLVADLLAMADMAEAFVRDVETSAVALVADAVREIVAGFDDETLVETVVRRGLRALGEGGRVKLGVPEALKREVERRLGELVADGSLEVVAEPSLSGRACRLESGRLIISGDVDEQIEALRTAIEERLGIERAAGTDPHSSDEVAGSGERTTEADA